MRNVLEGLSLFQRIAYPRHRELFERLADKQTPQAVFMTCSDSRIDPTLLVQAEPGDLFIVRNAGNIVPPAGGGAIGGTIASLEDCKCKDGMLSLRRYRACGRGRDDRGVTARGRRQGACT